MALTDPAFKAAPGYSAEGDQYYHTDSQSWWRWTDVNAEGVQIPNVYRTRALQEEMASYDGIVNDSFTITASPKTSAGISTGGVPADGHVAPIGHVYAADNTLMGKLTEDGNLYWPADLGPNGPMEDSETPLSDDGNGNQPNWSAHRGHPVFLGG